MRRRKIKIPYTCPYINKVQDDVISLTRGLRILEKHCFDQGYLEDDAEISKLIKKLIKYGNQIKGKERSSYSKKGATGLEKIRELNAKLRDEGEQAERIMENNLEYLIYSDKKLRERKKSTREGLNTIFKT
jgi:hypothetical protein